MAFASSMTFEVTMKKVAWQTVRNTTECCVVRELVHWNGNLIATKGAWMRLDDFSLNSTQSTVLQLRSNHHNIS